MADINEAFTGTTGAVPSGWTVTPSGSATIQSNAFRIISPASAYGTRRASRAGLANGDLTVDVTISTLAEHYPEILVRSSSATAYANGYALDLLPDVGSIALREWTGGAYADLQTAAFTFTAGSTYTVRFRFSGSTLQAKIWLKSGSEPASWMVSATDASVSAAGTIHLIATAGAAATARTVTYDNLAVTDLDVLQSPATVLNIGTGAGKNYFALQYARPGDPDFIVKSLADLAAGFTESPYFYTTTGSIRVHFEARLDAPTTPGSASSRAELREQDSSGNDCNWNATSGEHILQGAVTITTLPPVKPEVVIAQMFGEDRGADCVSIRTQLVSGTIRLRVRVNGTSITSPQIASPYATGTRISWKIRMISGTLEVYWATGAAALPGTPQVSDATSITETRAYWKLGLYNQSNVAAGDAGTAVGAAEHEAFSVYHSVPVSPSTPTPISASDSAAVSEALALRQQSTLIDSATVTEALGYTSSAAVSDSAAGSETLALQQASAFGDTATVGESAALQRNSSLADSAIGTESLNVTTIEYKNFTDSATGTEGAPSIFDAFFVNIADSAAVTENAAISSTTSADDSAAGSEALALRRASSAADIAAGSEALALQQQFVVSDSATVTEAVSYAANPAANDSAAVGETLGLIRSSLAIDAAVGAETVGLIRSSSANDAAAVSESVAVLSAGTPVADSAAVTESIAILRISVIADSAAGTESPLAAGPYIFDNATVTEELIVVDIPFTQAQVLREGPVYDLVVVARIPQVSAPPTFIQVDPIEWKSLTYRNTLSKSQELSASCLTAGVTEPILQRLRSLSRLATELWLYRNGRCVFAGPLLGWQTADETLTLQARGLLSYLQMMTVASDQRFAQVDQFTIAKTLVDQWQNLEYGNFGIDTSSVGASGKLRDGTYLASELHNVGTRVEELGQRQDGFDVEVDPGTRKLQLWYPTKGVDRSAGENAIVLDARNITSGDVLCSVAPGDLASEAFGTGTAAGADGTLLSVQSNLELRAQYGRTAVTASWSDVSEQATLDAHTSGLLDARGAALLVPGPNVRVTPDADLDAYRDGDSVAYELNTQLGVSGTFRIRSQTVKVASTGQESVDLEFV